MRYVVAVAIITLCIPALGQTRDEVITARTREFHRIICQDDPAVWKEFVLSNYTKALQERQMKQKVSTDAGTTTTVDTGEALEAKVKMLSRLHDDFGKGKLVSVKPAGNDVEMVATGADGMTGKFKLKFEKHAPYLIDGIMVELGQ